jgi:hypothetical protein
MRAMFRPLPGRDCSARRARDTGAKAAHTGDAGAEDARPG